MSAKHDRPQQSLAATMRDIGVTGAQLEAIAEAFDSEAELVEYLTDTGDLTELAGVGGRTTGRIMRWFEAEYPEQYRDRLRNDDSIVTMFRPVHGKTVDGDGEYVFAFEAICPKCKAGIQNRGNPRGFMNRPYPCTCCEWVVLYHAEFLEPFAERHYDGGDSA